MDGLVIIDDVQEYPNELNDEENNEYNNGDLYYQPVPRSSKKLWDGSHLGKFEEYEVVKVIDDTEYSLYPSSSSKKCKSGQHVALVIDFIIYEGILRNGKDDYQRVVDGFKTCFGIVKLGTYGITLSGRNFTLVRFNSVEKDTFVYDDESRSKTNQVVYSFYPNYFLIDDKQLKIPLFMKQVREILAFRHLMGMTGNYIRNLRMVRNLDNNGAYDKYLPVSYEERTTDKRFLIGSSISDNLFKPSKREIKDEKIDRMCSSIQKEFETTQKLKGINVKSSTPSKDEEKNGEKHKEKDEDTNLQEFCKTIVSRAISRSTMSKVRTLYDLRHVMRSHVRTVNPDKIWFTDVIIPRLSNYA